MAYSTIRPAFAAILIKTETTEGVDAAPTGANDAIPVEQDSITFTNPWKMLDTNEATGILVDSAPVAVGQPATITFRSRIKGAGAGVTYSSTVKPPHFAALAGCGKRGYFQAAIATTVATAGTTISATLGTGFAVAAQAYRGMPAVISSGTNSGATPMITDYSASKIATFSDLFSTACDVTSSIAIPANWTYSGTSPKDPANRATDHPSLTIYFYKDGLLYKFVGCRGQVDVDATTNDNGFFMFSYTGVFAGQSDSPLPATLNYASQSAPLFLQQAGADLAFSANRKALPVSKIALKKSATVDSPIDPNSAYGFQPAVITQRSPSLSYDPLMTLTATRQSLNEIGSSTNYPAVIRLGQVNGNRAAITLPVIQPVQANPATRGTLATEDLMAKVLASPTQDAQNRDSDWIISYW